MIITRAAIAAVAWAAVQLSHGGAVDLLTSSGLTWSSSGNCDDRQNPNCTSFEGIRQATIDGIITLKVASGCPVNVTGGTEVGHGYGGLYTHYDGWKIDISRDGCIDSYIKTGFHSLGYISGWGYQYRSPAGNLYTDEGDHWDILYYNCGGCEPEPAAEPSVAPTAGPSAAPTAEPAGPATSTIPSSTPATQPGVPVLQPDGPAVQGGPAVPGPGKKRFRYKG